MNGTRTRPTLMNKSVTPAPPTGSTAALLREVVAHLLQNRNKLREEWLRRVREARLLTAMTEEEIFAEATSVYDNYVSVLQTGSVEAVQAYAPNLSQRLVPRGVETHEVIGIVLLLRDVLARSLFSKYHANLALIDRILPSSVELTLPPLGVIILKPEEQAEPASL